MKKNMVFFLVFFLVLSGFSGSFAQDVSSDEIRMTIPRTVIVKLIKAALPVNINTGPFIKGEIRIQAIDRLRIGADQVAFELTLRGRDVQFETRLGKQSLKVDLGQLNTTFDCTATLRFDRAKSLIYITPQLKPVASKTEPENRASDLLPGLVNGVEFPIEIQKFQPVVTDLGHDRLRMDLEITRIYTEKDRIMVTGLPKFEKTGSVR